MKIQKKLLFVRFSAKKTHKHTVSKYIQLALSIYAPGFSGLGIKVRVSIRVCGSDVIIIVSLCLKC